MMDWSEYLRQMGGHMRALGHGAPSALDGFRTLDAAAFKPQHLDPKTAELIALAVSVTTRCDGCIGVHALRAAKLGASEAEVAEALSVAVAINAGSALVYAGRAMDALGQATASHQPAID
jgi:AhpD family alkylhydroperoxidase